MKKEIYLLVYLLFIKIFRDIIFIFFIYIINNKSEYYFMIANNAVFYGFGKTEFTYNKY